MTTNNYFRGDAVKKVWLNRYPADVPAEINPDRYQSLVELFEHATTRYADQPAFINMGEVMTYRKLPLIFRRGWGYRRAIAWP